MNFSYPRKGSREAKNRSFSLNCCAIRTTDEDPTVLGPPVNDLDRHYGQRCTSPERQFPCDGWCRTTMSGTTLEYPNVVSQHFNHPLTPSYLLP